jgi:hypothetical protein
MVSIRIVNQTFMKTKLKLFHFYNYEKEIVIGYL